jgi:hypothetical protein
MNFFSKIKLASQKEVLVFEWLYEEMKTEILESSTLENKVQHIRASLKMAEVCDKFTKLAKITETNVNSDVAYHH